MGDVIEGWHFPLIKRGDIYLDGPPVSIFWGVLKELESKRGLCRVKVSENLESPAI